MTEHGQVLSSVLHWREGLAGAGDVAAERGDVGRRTTFVAKVAARWVQRSRAVLVTPEPFVAYDERAADPLRVERAGELAPILPCSAMIVGGGAARVTLAGPLGPRVVESSRSGVGFSMAAPERGRFAPTPPSRGDDGLLVVPADLDARFFHAAPESQHMPLLRGAESVTIESALGRVDTSLPGVVAVALVRRDHEERRLVLALDLLVFDVGRGQTSLVGRASVRGAWELVSLTLAPVDATGTSDRGDPRKHRPDSRARIEAVDKGGGLADTAPISSSVVAQMRARGATPFEATPPLVTPVRTPARTGGAGAPPATPFEGFRPPPVHAGQRLDDTLTDVVPVRVPPPAVVALEDEPTTLSERDGALPPRAGAPPDRGSEPRRGPGSSFEG